MIENNIVEIRKNGIINLVDRAKKESDQGNFLGANENLSSARNEYELLICKVDNSDNFRDLKNYIIEGHRYNKINRSLRNESCKC